jgi:predicted ribosome quality control (RQC) complex YloA/Tae2 family protein
MGKILDSIKVKISEFRNYLEVSKMIAEDIVKNKKDIKDIDKKIMEYRENGKGINEIKKDLKENNSKE